MGFYVREILCPQHFHKKSYVIGCYLLLLMGKKVISVLDLNLKPVTTYQWGFVVKMLWKYCRRSNSLYVKMVKVGYAPNHLMQAIGCIVYSFITFHL